ncbi:MAG TPA: SPOR domain-containing protein [Chitinophagaceae bacterium]|nr:SPOR domain-containing protein [Chitinophagaceae bacterium]
MRYLLLLAGVLVLNAGFAQSTDTAAQNAVLVHKDPRVELLVKKQAAINASTRRTARTARGYRLMVISTNKRDEAIAAKTKIYSYYPDMKAYLVYQSPFFRLKAGNFKSREEAERMRKQMLSLFPKGVFIVNDTIEIKPEENED